MKSSNIHIKLGKLIAVLALLLIGGQVWGATVYVSKSTANGYAVGDDANTYAQAQNKATPWLTVSKAVSTASVNGDTIVINDGTYAEAAPISPGRTPLTVNSETDYGAIIQSASGTSYTWIVPTAGHTITLGKIVIDANNAQSTGFTTGGNNMTVTLNATKVINYKSSGVTVAGNTTLTSTGAVLQAAYTAGTSKGFTISTVANATVSISGGSITHTMSSGTSQNQAISLVPSAGELTATVSGVTITFNLSGTNGSEVFGIRSAGTKYQNLNNNIIDINGLKTTVNGYGITVSGTAALPVTTATVYQNSIDLGDTNTTGAYSTGIRIGEITSGANDNTISGANVYENTVNDAGFGIGVGWSTVVSVYKNRVSDSWNGILSTGGTSTKVYNNLITIGGGANDKVGLKQQAATNEEWYNNTVDMGPNGGNSWGILCQDSGAVHTTGALIKNNIIFKSTDTGGSMYYAVIAADNTATLANNLYFGSDFANPFSYQGTAYATLALWQAAGYDANSINSNPLFISATNFSLQSTSPAAGSGVLITGYHDQATPATDFAGVDVTWGPSIGAYQPTGSTPTWSNLHGLKLLRASQAVTITGDHSAEIFNLSDPVNTGTLTVTGGLPGKIIGNAAVTIKGVGQQITTPIELGDNVKMQGFRFTH